MEEQKALYIYPYTSEVHKEGANSYMRNLISHLSKSFKIVNKKTTIGALDMLLKIHKYDIIYLNWIEEIPDRRFGIFQVPLFVIVMGLAKLLKVRIVWFVHNNVSHNKTNIRSKRFIVNLMKNTADLILSHSNNLTLKVPKDKFYSFHHPVEPYQAITTKQPYEYDILVWGAVSPYKGVSEFVEYVAKSPGLKTFRVLIAGRFISPDHYHYINSIKPANITLINKILPEPELAELFSKCRYVLFTYNSPSVLSSAALCKTLSFGKEIIGPAVGSFKELGDNGLVYNYQSFSSLESLLNDLKSRTVKGIDKERLIEYIRNNSWDKFAEFLANTIHTTFSR